MPLARQARPKSGDVDFGQKMTFDGTNPPVVYRYPADHYQWCDSLIPALSSNQNRASIASGRRARRGLGAANQLARHRVGCLAVDECDLAANDRVFVTVGVLDQSSPTRRQIKHHLRRMQSERV